MDAGEITILVAVMTLVVMIGAYFLSKNKLVHISVMGGVIAFDLIMPVYLLLTRDWYTRLIEREDILTFGVWMHFFVVLVLYVLYLFQILAALKILKKEDADGTARNEHRAQAKGIILIRAFVIFTGALLYDPEYIL